MTCIRCVGSRLGAGIAVALVFVVWPLQATAQPADGRPISVAGDDGHGHKEIGEILIGRSAGGQLTVEFASDEAIVLPAVSGLLNGWGGDVPGVGSLGKDEPKENLFVLGEGAQIALQVVSFDPGFRGITPGFSSIFYNAGDTWTIGGPTFDQHPFWHIDSDDPLFNPTQTEWMATFRFIDLGATAYSASDEITARFTNIPEPATLCLLAMGALLLGRSRARRRSPFMGGNDA